MALDSWNDYNPVIFRVRPGSFWLHDCEDEGTVILQDVRNFSPNNQRGVASQMIIILTHLRDIFGSKSRLPVFQVHGTNQLGVKDCLKHLLQEGGTWSLWRGNGMNVVKIAPESAIKFMAYEQAKKIIRGNSTRELSIYERFVAGSVAGGISQTVIYPLEVCSVY